jgi:outer membrane protein TolC
LLASISGAALAGLSSAQDLPSPAALTLKQAVAIALEKNPQRKAVLADTKAAASDVRVARSFLLPRVTFSEVMTRGNDPVYVFGTKLRQQRFSDFDFALNVLNTPPPLGNFSTRFSGSWTLFDSLASWHSLDRAERMKEAAEHELERTDQELEYRVIEAYFGALLAKTRVGVAEQSLKTAQAIVERSKNRYETGVIVESDYLSAQVRAASRQQELIRAQHDLALARSQLSTAIGLSGQVEYVPADDLSERTLPLLKLEDAEQKAMTSRPDLRRIRSSEAAQQQSVAMAKSAFGPRVNAFAAWEADNPTFVAGGGGNNWLAGIEVQFDLFQGGAKRAQLAREQATQEKLGALQEVAKDAVRLEVRRAYYDMDAAKQQIEVARLAIAESRESLRVNQDRYDAGLSTITELLAAEEAARVTQTNYWETLCRYYTAYAALELAGGALNPQSPVVTP